MNKKEPHPWAVFLNARYNVILWMRDIKGYDDKEISENLSMDEIQVFLIRISTHMPIPEGTTDWVRPKGDT